MSELTGAKKCLVMEYILGHQIGSCTIEPTIRQQPGGQASEGAELRY